MKKKNTKVICGRNDGNGSVSENVIYPSLLANRDRYFFEDVKFLGNFTLRT